MAADAYQSLYLFALGHAATASRSPEFVEIQRQGLAYLASLPADAYPTIRMVAPSIGARPPVDRFETGLTVVLDGIAGLRG